jgi:hypothetical protein
MIYTFLLPHIRTLTFISYCDNKIHTSLIACNYIYFFQLIYAPAFASDSEFFYNES